MSEEGQYEAYGLGDGWTVPAHDQAWWEGYYDADSPNGQPAEPAKLVVERLVAFARTHEEPPVALLGSGTETLLPDTGMLLMYGDGGAGKTTVTIDALFHMAAGRSWLGQPVGRPVRLFVIENEGPRSMFRQRLDEKLGAWDEGFDPEVQVLAEPWSEFTLRDTAMRTALAEQLTTAGSDVLVMGPLATLGTVGGGTAEDILSFEHLLTELRGHLAHPLALWIVHHENKAGDVSGAWERVPDTMVHVQGLGHGMTQLVWRKARWSSELHGTTMQLRWGEGRTYEVVEKEDRDPEGDLLAMYEESNEWRTVAEARAAADLREGTCRAALKNLVGQGKLEVAQGDVAGKSKQAKVYRLREAEVIQLPGAADKVRRPDDEFEF